MSGRREIRDRESEPVVRVEGVSRWFGSVVAVNDVSFEIGPGITGLLGPNGAGKTTLLRLITGQAKPSAGTVRVFGESPRGNPELYRRMGVVTEHEAVYGFLTGRQFVRTMGRLRGAGDGPGEGAGGLDAAVTRALELVGLTDAADRKTGGYSRGMRQRIRLAAALVHDPELLLLDEPLKGADPRQRAAFQELVERLAGEDRTVVISSHILEEVQQLADTVLLIVDGKLAASGGFRAIRAALNERPYHVRIVSDAPRELASAVVRLDSVDAVSLDPDGAVVVLSRNVRQLQVELPRLARSASIGLRRVEPLDDSLESVFGYLVEG
jgi:ABC-2 type transport system ATP-binding protein